MMANASDGPHLTTDGGVANTPEAFATFPQPPSALPLASIIVGLVTGVTGTFANAVVFVVFGLKNARVTSGR